MRVISAEALAALDSGRFIVRCLLKVETGEGVFAIWDDVGTIEVDGVTYLGAAGRFAISGVTSSADLSVRNLDVQLSGLDSEVVNLIEGATWHQRPIAVQRVIIATEAPQILHLMPVFTGFLDQMIRRERVDGIATVVFRCEDVARELSRRGARTRSDSDQRQRDPADGFFKHTVNSVQTNIDWGRAPTAATPRPKKKLFGVF